MGQFEKESPGPKKFLDPNRHVCKNSVGQFMPSLQQVLAR